MRTQVIRANTIDVAVEKILVKLQADTTSSGENVIYFDGWDGLGASAVLQGVANHITISNEPSTMRTGLEFEKIIYIDCSKWVNRRAVQREIAEQLKLPNWVIEIFDKQDEEDDFNGLDQISRSEIAQVVREIDQTTRNQRFLVILHNGGNEEIDIFKFGLSLYGYANSKMLWTFQGRFRLDPKMVDNVKKSTTTDVLLLASSDGRDPQELWSYLVCQEATQICCNMHVHGIIDPAIAAKCVLYMLKQFWIGSHVIDYDWAVHTSNYCVCNGIITLADIDKAWQVGDVLQREVRLLNIHNRPNDESTIMPSSHQARSAERMPYWISTGICGFVQNSSSVIPDNMFQHSQRLSVLKLSWCTFNLSSPPFLCCHSLRFLWLDHCQDLPTRSTTDHHHTDAYKEELDHSTTASWQCFQSLWVLDLRYTDCERILSARMMDLMTQLRELNVMGAKNWDMSHLQGRVRNIRKLRVTKSTCCFNHDVLTEMESLELLDFSGNIITQGMKSLFGPANNSSLETVIVGGCDGLKIISFRGCKELKNFLLKGSLGSLEELELSGTSVKTLDLRGVEDRSFHKRIILLGCEKLRAILWPLNAKQRGWSKVLLHIDTTSPSISAYRGEAPLAHAHADRSLHQQKEEIFKDGWRISLTDTRLLRSLSHFKTYLDELYIHIDVGPAVNVGGSNIQGASKDKLVQVQPHTSTTLDSKYRDALKDGPIAAMMMWDCPKITLDKWTQRTCIIKVIMHGKGSKILEDAPDDFIRECVRSLHVYDNPSINGVCTPPQGSRWVGLKWCRVERCPKLHTVFSIPQNDWFYNFRDLETFWASQLQSARYIWDKAVRNDFQYLNFFHVDHCPRLVYVLCFSIWGGFTFVGLKTLEIVYCGDIREVFHLGPELHKQDIILEFPKLRHIHLHELPMLQRIGGRWMSAPNLETIKIRGCWSLKHLPAVGRDTKPPKVDCEKEWWDNLEWDGLEKYHHPSLYEPSHSLYYKAQLPRGTVLR